MSYILFNGKRYNGIDEMPADQRAAYEQVMAFLKDENNNGIPDIFEGDVAQKIMGMVNTRVIVNGQEVQHLDSLPPEARDKFEKAMSRLSQIGLISPGFPSQVPMQSAPKMAQSEPTFEQSQPLLKSSPSVISEETGSRTGIVIALVVLLLCALAVIGILVYLKF